MKLKIRKSKPRAIEIPRFVSLTISDIPNEDMENELKVELAKAVPKIVIKCGGQLTIEESTEKYED